MAMAVDTASARRNRPTPGACRLCLMGKRRGAPLIAGDTAQSLQAQYLCRDQMQ